MGAADTAIRWLSCALLALCVGAPVGAFAVLMAAVGGVARGLVLSVGV